MARTTLDIDERILLELRRRAADEGRALHSVVNELLDRALHPQTATAFSLHLQGWQGEVQPGVDILDRDSLFDVMNGR